MKKEELIHNLITAAYTLEEFGPEEVFVVGLGLYEELKSGLPEKVDSDTHVIGVMPGVEVHPSKMLGSNQCSKMSKELYLEFKKDGKI